MRTENQQPKSDYLSPRLEEVEIQAEKDFSYSPEGWDAPDFSDEEEIW